MTQMEASDFGRRAVVYTMKADTVLIKVASKEELGLRRVIRDNMAVEAKHRELANKLGVNPNAYGGPGKRDVPDTGLKVIHHKHGVSLRDFIPVLQQRGYGFTDGHSFARKLGKDPINVLIFTLGGAEKPVPPNVSRFLNRAILLSLFVWANRTAAGKRLDTINATDSGQRGCARKTLVLAGDMGNSYAIAESR